MNEEEKIAMLELNRYVYGKQLSKDDIVDYMSILFGLIHKQEKEIEELKKDRYLYNSETGEITKIKSNSISKDKIMEIAKEYIEDETIDLHGFYMKVMRLLEKRNNTIEELEDNIEGRK